MSRPEIRKALETHLSLLLPAIDTSWENKAFKPRSGLPYQRVNLLPATPEGPEIGSFSRELGLFQITLMYPGDGGPGEAEARAELIRQHFPKGLNLVVNGIVTTISGTLQKLRGDNDGDRWALPVRIPYFANIS
jgi:hypothetical protein